MSSSRRTFLQVSAGAVATLAAGCRDREGTPAPPAEPSPAPAPAPAPKVDTSKVRIASVPTAVEGNLLPELLKDVSPRNEIVSRPDVYEAARAGKADLVVSHYGHRDCEQFVLDGLGEWPRTVFSNQMALVGPPSDPAKIRGMADAAEAFARIAAAKSPFVLNDLDGVRYLTEILWNASGRPPRDGWFVDGNHQREAAMQVAQERGGYVLWGLTPFLRARTQYSYKLEPLVLADPLLQRMLVTVVVKMPGCNIEGARALQAHLLAPATQARIRATPYPTDGHVCWVPAGRHNRTGMLPKA
jgi:tungstate transport system substrate-binding protein